MRSSSPLRNFVLSSFPVLLGTTVCTLGLALTGCPAEPATCNSDSDCTGGDVCRAESSGELLCGEPTSTPTPRPSISEFSASDSPISAGESSTLTWTAVDAETCTLTNSVDDTEATDVASTGSLVVTPEFSTTYTLTCENAGVTATDVVNVVVNRPVSIESFAASDTAINFGSEVTLTWTVANASRCLLDDGTDEIPAPDGDTVTYTPETSTTYTLACSGFPEEVSQSVTVEVARILALDLDQILVAAPGTVNASWTTEGTGSCDLAVNGVLIVDDATTETTAEINVTAGGAYDVDLTCEGNGGPITASRQLFAPAVETFTATPNPVASGADVVFAFTAVEVDSCEISRIDGSPTVLLGGLGTSGDATLTNVTEAQDVQLSCTRTLGADVLTVTSDVISLELQ